MPEKQHSTFSSRFGYVMVAAGAAIGAGVALLFAPQEGAKTRADLKKKIDELIKKTKDVDIKKMAEDLKKDLQDLDKEKVAKIAKEKAHALIKKADELVKLAKKKAEPTVEKVAEDIKAKTRELLESSLEKLDDKKTKKAK